MKWNDLQYGQRNEMEGGSMIYLIYDKKSNKIELKCSVYNE